MKSIARITGLMLALSATIAFADENPLIGTWKLKSYVIVALATGERANPFGEHPLGYLSYSPDGRMHAIITADNRVRPRGALPEDEERVKLHQTMFAYAGTFTLDGEKVIHPVDISWNQLWNETDLVRSYKVNGSTLTITNPPSKNPKDGREEQGVLVWEKVKASTQ